MLDSGRDRLALLRGCSEEAGNGIGGVVGHRAAVSSGDGGPGWSRGERCGRRGRCVTPGGACVGEALSGGGSGGGGGSVASDGVLSASEGRRSLRRWSASCGART